MYRQKTPVKSHTHTRSPWFVHVEIVIQNISHSFNKMGLKTSDFYI